MNKDEIKIGRINAVMYASEEVISRCPPADKGTALMAKEVAYDQIKQILNGKCPWSEVTE